MKTLLTLASVSMLCVSPVFAGGSHRGGGHHSGGHFGGGVSAQAGASARASSSATAFGGTGIGYGGSANVVNNITNSGDASANSYGGRGRGRGRGQYQIPGAVAPSFAYGGGNECGSQFSLGVPYFSIGIPIEQTNCTYRANAVTVTQVTGNRTAGMLVLAQEPGMRSAMVGAGLLVEAQQDASGNWFYPQQAQQRVLHRAKRRGCNC